MCPLYPPRRIVRYGLAAAALLAAAGCSLRNDPHYNPHAPHNGAPTVMQRADRLANTAEQTLDNARQRLENIID